MKTRKTIQQHLAAIVGTCAILLSADTSFAAPAVIKGPVYNSATKHYYYLLESDTWTNSQAAAVTLGGNLVTVNDAAENQWIISAFQNHGGVLRHLWIGLNDFATQGTFDWVGGPSTYTNWFRPDQPDLIGTERAVLIFGPATVPNSGKWNNFRDVASITQADFVGPINGVVEVPADDCCCNPPAANNDNFNYGVERPTFPLQLNVLGNDTEPKGYPLFIVNVFPPELATISPNGTSLQFTPPSNFTGTASVWYEVSNGPCSSWAVATVRFDNSPPTAVDDTRWSPFYSASTVFTVNAAANDLDANDQPKLKITGFIPPLTGNVVIDTANNVLKFTCNNGFNGKEQFVYTVSDGFGGTSSAYVFIHAGRTMHWVGDVSNPASGARALVDVNVGTGGDATGTVVWDGQTYRFKAAMVTGPYDWEPIVIPPKKRGLPPITIDLDLVDGVVIATVGDGIKQATGPIEVANTNQTPGYYTFLIAQPTAPALSAIKGQGYGGLTINANGTFNVKGAMPDGVAFSSAGSVVGTSVFFASQLNYLSPTTAGTQGSCLAAIQLPTGAATNITGNFAWSKPAQTVGAPSAAFTFVTVPAHGEFYTPPVHPALPLTLGTAPNCDLDFIPPGGVLSANAATMVSKSTSYGVVKANGPASSHPAEVKYFLNTGFIKGSLYVAPKKYSAAGALIQGSSNIGGGHMIGKPFTGSGPLEIVP